MIFDFDKFDRYCHPSLFLCKPNEEIIGQISNYDGLSVTPRFNDMSEIKFKVYRFLSNGEVSPVYEKIEKMREIFVGDFYVRSESETHNVHTIRSLAQKYTTLADFGNNNLKHYYKKNAEDGGLTRPLGYFIITDVDEVQNLSNPYKSVTALSCEYELTQKELHYIDGTYRIYEQDNDDCIINQILARLPKWDLNYIDEGISNLYRTFEFGENTIYNFLMSDFADAADAIVEFDVFNRLISIYAKETYVSAASQYTGIVISLNDVIDEIKSNDSLNDFYTALYVPSNGDINIANVNPSRNNTIYNFDKYMSTDWMSQGLINGLNTVKENIANTYTNCTVTVNNEYKSTDTSNYQIATHNEVENVGGVDVTIVTPTDCDLYYFDETAWEEIDIDSCTAIKPLNIMKAYEMEKLVLIESQLDTLTNADLAGYEAQKAAVISSDATTAQKNAELATINGYIAATQQQIEAKTTEFNNKQDRILDISTRINELAQGTQIEEVLTQKQLDELSPFIHEASFSDDTIIATDSMSYVDEYNQSEALYEKAVKALNSLSEQNVTFSIDVNSSLFSKYFSHITESVNTGAIINVIDLDDNCTQYILHAFEIEFDSNSISLTFGNRFHLDDPISTFADLYSATSKTGNTLNYIRNTFDFSKANTELSASEKFRNSSLDLSRNAIVSSDNQTVDITDNGYMGRRVEDGVVSDEQCWLVNNALAFTDDNWATVKTALGKMPIYDPVTEEVTYKYGLNSEVLMGKAILGENMWIGDDDGDVIIDGDGVLVNNGKIKIMSDSESDTELLIDTPKFTVAKNGDMNCNSGTFSGNIYLTGDDSKLLIGEHGVLSHIQFNSTATKIGWEETMSDLIEELYTNVGGYIPSNFNITHAYVSVVHTPLKCLEGYWQASARFTNQVQYARKISLFTATKSRIEYVQNSDVGGQSVTKGIEFSDSMGSDGWTPSNTTVQTKTSIDIASYLTSGAYNQIVIATRESEPALPTDLSTYLNNVFCKQGIVEATLDIYGYLEQ